MINDSQVMKAPISFSSSYVDKKQRRNVFLLHNISSFVTEQFALNKQTSSMKEVEQGLDGF